MHGQITVMAVMAIIYTLILKLAGLQFALTIGIISGALVFIPYVGFLLACCWRPLPDWGNLIRGLILF